MRGVLNLLLPSATAGVSLECRLFLPSPLPAAAQPADRSPPSPAALDALKAHVRALGVRKLVTAAHPWGRLGGNQDFP